MASLGLGFLSWYYNRKQTLFLSDLEEFVATMVMPYFTQMDLDSVDSIQSAGKQLAQATKTLEYATTQHVSVMGTPRGLLGVGASVGRSIPVECCVW